jgi:hypothetical protein
LQRGEQNHCNTKVTLTTAASERHNKCPRTAKGKEFRVDHPHEHDQSGDGECNRNHKRADSFSEPRALHTPLPLVHRVPVATHVANILARGSRRAGGAQTGCDIKHEPLVTGVTVRASVSVITDTHGGVRVTVPVLTAHCVVQDAVNVAGAPLRTEKGGLTHIGKEKAHRLSLETATE